MKFLLDANFLMVPFKFKVDIFRELEKFGKPELYTLDMVLEELGELSKKKGRNARAARLALILIKKKGVKTIKSGLGSTDAQILKTATQENFTVCTLDKELEKGLHARKVPVVFLRQKKFLDMR